MKSITILGLVLVLGVALPTTGDDQKSGAVTTDKTQAKSIYDFTVKNIDGADVKLDTYRDKVLLVVNVASRCGYTKRNYKELEPLYRAKKDKGFEVLAFPANNFMGQEPGSNEDIKMFCTKEFDVTFPLFAKVSVKGKDICPLYGYLTTLPDKEIGGDIRWNFDKFLVNREGKVIQRFPYNTPPSDTRMIKAIEAALAAPAPSDAKGSKG